MSDIGRLLLVGGAAACFGLLMAKKAKKKPSKPIEPVEPTPAKPNIALSGSSNGWIWRARNVAGSFYGDILAPGSNLWQPVNLQGYNIPEKAKEMTLRFISYAKDLAAKPSGKIMEEGVLHKWGWRIRMMGEVEDINAEYVGEILAPGAVFWTPAHLDRRDNRPDVKLLAEEAINAARDLAVTGA